MSDDGGRVSGLHAPGAVILFFTTFADATPCRDGDPIFSASDPVRRIGVRVIPFEPNGDTGELASWRDTFARGEPEEIEELVISCSLTEDTFAGP